MPATLLLVRNAATEWSKERRVTGRRDLALSTEGRRQAAELGARLAGVELAEILCSPLLRAVETAEAIGKERHLDVTRDARLLDLDLGPLEGQPQRSVLGHADYRRLVDHPESAAVPGGEALAAVAQRVVGSARQAVADNEIDSCIAIVSHSAPLRILLAHFLGMDLGQFRRLRLPPAAVALLRFEDADGPPRILGIDCGIALTDLLGDR